MSSKPAARLSPPFRAEHVGSLLRPAALFQKRTALDAMAYSSPHLQPEEDEAVRSVVAMQREIGLRLITDGEVRRRFFFDGVFENLEGMEKMILPMSDFKASFFS
jgi:methionine synthase II (cobalamin-independent)